MIYDSESNYFSRQKCGKHANIPYILIVLENIFSTEYSTSNTSHKPDYYLANPLLSQILDICQTHKKCIGFRRHNLCVRSYHFTHPDIQAEWPSITPLVVG